ncbi:DUF2878 domain-containing protein [Kaarinaea lacus]
MQLVINFVLFQLGWFACVIGAARQLEWLAVLSIVLIIAIHLFLVKDRMRELQLILTAGMLGLVLDSALISLGVFTPASNLGLHNIAPLWLISLWMLFGITLNHSLRWLQQRYIIAALMGFVFAPLAYWAGQRLGALSFPPDHSPIFSLLVIGACWLLITPLLLLSSQYLSRRHLRQNHSTC